MWQAPAAQPRQVLRQDAAIEVGVKPAELGASIAQSAACLWVPTRASPFSVDRLAIASGCQEAAARQPPFTAGNLRSRESS